MSLLDYLYPKFCIGCGTFGTYCCSHCLQTMPHLPYLKCPVCTKPSIDGRTHSRCRTPYMVDGLTSMYPYRGIVRKIITKTKYQFVYRGMQDLLNTTSSAFWEYLTPTVKKYGKRLRIIPIPLYFTRQRIRGFNQAELIARWLAKQTSHEVDTAALVRIRKTIPQVEMQSRSARLTNMDGVFRWGKGNTPLPYDAVLLVDDVYTTGATMQSAASVLKHHGIHMVWGVTVAQ